MKGTFVSVKFSYSVKLLLCTPALPDSYLFYKYCDCYHRQHFITYLGSAWASCEPCFAIFCYLLNCHTYIFKSMRGVEWRCSLHVPNLIQRIKKTKLGINMHIEFHLLYCREVPLGLMKITLHLPASLLKTLKCEAIFVPKTVVTSFTKWYFCWRSIRRCWCWSSWFCAPWCGSTYWTWILIREGMAMLHSTDLICYVWNRILKVLEKQGQFFSFCCTLYKIYSFVIAKI